MSARFKDPVENYDFVHCRLLGHSWRFVVSDWTSTLRGRAMTVRCDRCDMERRDTFSEITGQLMARHYIRPDGYKLPKGYHPNRADWRRVWAGR